jgi:Putative MetA-pathway of phenol degradation
MKLMTANDQFRALSRSRGSDLSSGKFGDWEAGLVAFGSTDLNVPIAGYQKQRQIAVGALIGHSFGPVILQAYLTTDVYEKNYGGHDTRLWGRFIIPVWLPPTPPTTPLYRKG